MSFSLSGKRILIVDDEPDLREVVSFEFKAQGCEIFEAASGEEAWSLLQCKRIDLIISDVRMPDGNGVDLLKRVHKTMPQIPVILMTGFADLQSTDAIQNGASAMFGKPLDRKALLRGAENALRVAKGGAS